MVKTYIIVLGSGLVFGFIVGLVTSLLLGDPWGLPFLIWGALGLPIGLFIGIILTNKVLHYRGSILYGIFGLILAVIIVGLIWFFLGHVFIGLILIITVIPVFTTLGYHSFKL